MTTKSPLIRQLPPEVANQIAAGEVIERPASVVKELVENALDAGARHIAITIELGGKGLVRVEDDGGGMSPADAALALQRHATSKISTAHDLAAIRTLGFRGEALPSIASVSHFVLRTRERGSLSGTEIRVDGGVTSSPREVAASEGTSIEVGELFYNLPARRKFLKADSAESAQITRLVTQIALGYCSVGVSLVSAGRRVMQCPPAATLRDRIYQVLGERPDLIELFRESAGIRITGFVAALAEQGPVRGPQHVFVNRRIVRDRSLQHAITDAYSTATIRERSPEVHLFLELAPDRVDVNVHPTKAEVRFLEPGLVHEVLRRALIDALGKPAVPSLRFGDGTAGVGIGGGFEGSPARGEGSGDRSLPGIYGEPLGASAAMLARDGLAVAMAVATPGTDPWTGASLGPVEGLGSDGRLAVGERDGESLVDRRGVVDPVRPMVPLGQLRDTFIIAIDSEGLLIVDQHVAHERILYEQVLERLTSRALESQRLLTPLVLDLSPAQVEALGTRGEDLARLGFEVEPFGERTVHVAAVPSIVRVEAAAAAIRALADDLEGRDRGAPVEVAVKHLAATIACHAAVKAHDPLTIEKMQYLLDELRRTAYSTICPHGRPVLLRVTRREIERAFDRA
ncbi:MAG: DNA mismatch repair endonuclease MutL [Vicinamibacteraceae bacterium]